MNNQEEEIGQDLKQRLAELDAIYKKRKRNITILFVAVLLAMISGPLAYLWNIKRADIAIKEKIIAQDSLGTAKKQLDQTIEAITGQEATEGTTGEKLKTLEIYFKQKCPELTKSSDETEQVCPPCNSCCPDVEPAVVEKPCPPMPDMSKYCECDAFFNLAQLQTHYETVYVEPLTAENVSLKDEVTKLKARIAELEMK